MARILVPYPPAISTFPFVKRTAVELNRAIFKLPVKLNAPATGSYSSALDRTAVALFDPPARSTLSLFSNVAMANSRATFKLLVGVKLFVTAKFTGLLAVPPTVTTTFPDVELLGTGTTIEVALQLAGVALVPLNFTVLVPWVEPKFVPVIVTDAPTAPVVGDRLLTLGAGTTVKLTPLLFILLALTTTLPVFAPVGTGATMDVELQLEGVAVVPLNFTVLVPWVEPKFVPVTVTDAPTAPEVGDRVVIEGATVNVTPLLTGPLEFHTNTGPVVAPVGTGTVIVLFPHVGEAVTPLNVTVPAVVPKSFPETVTEAPMAPEVGERVLILGPGNQTALLPTPLTVTTTLPFPDAAVATICVELQLLGVTLVPWKLTVLVPRVAPKWLPVIVTTVPPPPYVGERLVITGPLDETVNDTPLLAWPPTVTTTFPVVAPVGTGAIIFVAVQVVGVAVVPLNFTVLVP